LEEGKEEHIEIIFNEIYEHLLELMSGMNFFQKTKNFESFF